MNGFLKQPSDYSFFTGYLVISFQTLWKEYLLEVKLSVITIVLSYCFSLNPVVLFAFPQASAGWSVTITGKGILQHKWRVMNSSADSNLTNQRKEILQGPYKVNWPLPKDINRDHISAEFVIYTLMTRVWRHIKGYLSRLLLGPALLLLPIQPSNDPICISLEGKMH